MKPAAPADVTAAERRLVQRLLHSRLRPVAGGVYRVAIAVELLAVRALDALRGRSALGPDARDVTILVKTHERPRTVRRLVASIRRAEPAVRVLVVDDSRSPVALADADVIEMPYDSGVSAGRRAGLRAVTTPYVLVLDDDFVLYSGTRLDRALALITAHPEIDVMGGQVVDLPFFSRRTYAGVATFPTTAEPLRSPGSTVGGLPVRDKVANFFLARTDRLRLVDWDPALRRVDHADFFTRARGVLLSVENPDLRALHARTPFDPAYRRARLDVRADLELIERRWFPPPPDG